MERKEDIPLPKLKANQMEKSPEMPFALNTEQMKSEPDTLRIDRFHVPD